MLKLTRLLLLLAVALVAARPVMACCLTGHSEPAASHLQAEAPPCHGESNTSHATTGKSDHQPALPMECPGCVDCDLAVMQAQSVDDGALITQGSSDIPIAMIGSRFAGFQHEPTVYKTGPPGEPPGIHQTPITLKQRQLI